MLKGNQSNNTQDVCAGLNKKVCRHYCMLAVTVSTRSPWSRTLICQALISNSYQLDYQFDQDRHKSLSSPPGHKDRQTRRLIMFEYLSFLRPPPERCVLHQPITLVPQIANDLRTELAFLVLYFCPWPDSSYLGLARMNTMSTSPGRTPAATWIARA